MNDRLARTMINKFTIQEVETLSEVKAATLRMWEKRYNLCNPQRLDGGKRHYNLQELEVLVNIALLKRNGHQISRLAQMDAETILRKTASLTHKEDIFKTAINQLVVSMFSSENDLFETYLTDYWNQFGIDTVLQNIVIPFQEKVNQLSTASNCNEVLMARTAIKRKIIYCIESTQVRVKYDKTALLFLPKDEHDDLILLYMCYVLKMRGYRTLYLGSNIPEENIIIILKQRKPDHLFTYVTKENKLKMPALLSYMQDRHPEQKINVVGGNELEFGLNHNDDVINFINYKQFTDQLQSA